MFDPRFTESALGDLGYLNKTAQALVVSAIEDHNALYIRGKEFKL
jgi:hypothetical protein